MKEINKKETSINNDKIVSTFSQSSNPLSIQTDETNYALNDYSQSTTRPKYDKDIADVVEIVRILNNMAPIKMPVYNFNTDEINGEHYYKPDGTLLLIREYDSDVIRDYYVAKNPIDNIKVDRILEHDKKTGRLRVRIEPLIKENCRLKINITIFDDKISGKYTLMQLSEDGTVQNITEFTGKGKSFQTLFRNSYTSKPARYLEGRDNKENGFEMIDCLFDANGNVARIKRYNNKKEIDITYTEDKKNISVKTKG